MANQLKTKQMPPDLGAPLLDALPVEAGPPPLTILDALRVDEPLPPVTPPPLPGVLPPPPPPAAKGPPPLPAKPRPRGLIRGTLWRVGWLLWAISSVTEWLFGVVSLMIGLAVLAGLPVLQFLSLGYLLEAGGRIARTGRFRDGFIGVRLAARLGGIALGGWLLLWPVRIVASLTRAAQVIDPDGTVARNWRMGLFLLIAVTALHISAACARGGQLRYFFWPFNVFWLFRRLLRGGYYAEARDAVWDVTQSLRLPYYFWLGCRGFMAAMAWLVVPVSLLALGRAGGTAPVTILFGWLGALLLAFVLLYLPFLQMRMAADNRMSSAFDWRGARAEYRRAPWIFTLAFIVTLLTALPLYLLKIEMVPREAAWLPSLVFIAFIFPARILTGWALSWARWRRTPRHWFFRWTGRLPVLPAVAFYVLIVYFTQFTSWNGVWSLYEQHAFLVPVPFFGM